MTIRIVSDVLIGAGRALRRGGLCLSGLASAWFGFDFSRAENSAYVALL